MLRQCAVNHGMHDHPRTPILLRNSQEIPTTDTPLVVVFLWAICRHKLSFGCSNSTQVNRLSPYE